MYGLGDSISLQVDEDILYKTLKEAGYTTPIKLSVDGKDETYTLVRNVDRHPVTDKLVHVDFLRVDMEKEIEVQVPVVLINQDSATCTRGGAGVVTQGVYEVTILAKPLEIPSELEARLNSDFGSVEQFKEAFIQAGTTQFGSGWAWLAIDNGKLVVTKSPNASNPLVDGMKPILGCDVWEHSYYIDYRNRRPDYLKAFLDSLVNWEFVASQLD